uniref:Uncharacterized protein n=1 Tax=viral metagenome TaxID=1070528 RepID=A0A6C0C988_9ZZZZ
MDDQQKYVALEEKQTYTILCFFKTDDPQNIFVRSRSLNRFVMLICRILAIAAAVVIVESVIIFGGWRICRLTDSRSFCKDDTEGLGYIIFILMYHLLAFVIFFIGSVLVTLFISVIYFCRIRITDINNELKNLPDNIVGNESDVQILMTEQNEKQ